MDQIVSNIGRKNNLTLCGVFRGQALDQGVMLRGVNKIVTGKQVFMNDEPGFSGQRLRLLISCSLYKKQYLIIIEFKKIVSTAFSQNLEYKCINCFKNQG